MIRFFNRQQRIISSFLLMVFGLQIVPIYSAFALTSGPSQPEVQSFQPAGTSEMVDLFTGDFSYNIPLFELPGPNGGYPFNLSYQSGIGMDQEASWVGLGWNLQPGAINRQMRGLPDEFDGSDKVKTKMSMATNVTVGMGGGAGAEFFGADGLGLKLGFSVYQNSYKGIGYSIDGSLGYGKSSESGKTIGLGFGLDSKEGVNLSPSLSLGGKGVNFGLGVGYNSKEGLQNVSLDVSIDRRRLALRGSGNDAKIVQRGFKGSTGSTLSLTHPGYTPQITMPMSNSNISVTFKAGGAWWGVFGSAYITGFYNEQRLAKDKQEISSPAYGYLNYQLAKNNTDALLDLNREKDGVVTKESPNMAIPSLTYDIYSVAGQGISGMYRPMRNDYGLLRDQQIASETLGASAGVDLGLLLAHAGFNLSINHSRSVSGAWGSQDGNGMYSKADFLGGELDSKFEPWYFKSHGEPSADAIGSLDAIGGDNAVRVKLADGNNSPAATSSLEKSSREPTIALPTLDGKDQNRKIRNQAIQPYTREQLLIGNEEVLKHFIVEYVDQSKDVTQATIKKLDRSQYPAKHITAFTATTAEGLRYNYGIPAYNLSQEEVSFSARKRDGDTDRVKVVDPATINPVPHLANEPSYEYSGTDKYFRKVTMPSYAHSHLLTSILGPDYVDVTGNGVTPDDLGYWVKFTYTKTTSTSDPFKWRDPYSQAHFQQGWKSDPRDDKGSYVYGQKEIWYLSSAETKSHVAKFSISKREDGKGVSSAIQDNDNILPDTQSSTGNLVYKLDEIKLFSRYSTVPIKVAKFSYEYQLCQNTFNSSSSGAGATKGKLTLKALKFEYGGSQRGGFNPYEFTYNNNPTYRPLSYDRWGNYKPFNALVPNYDFPYVPQDPSQREQIDLNAAAWSLTGIRLPSGGNVIVDYESDDYAYVQHKQAMQMMELVDDGLSDGSLKVRFKLERPLNPSTSEIDRKKEALKYLDMDSKQVYFKLLMSLRKPSEKFDEYISGYANIVPVGPNDLSNTQLIGLEQEGGTGDYVYGFFYLQAEDQRHPFSMRAWQHLRTNQPELANSGATLEPQTDVNKQIDQILSLGSVLDQVNQMFGGFYNFCSGREWGRKITANKSWVRLLSPDKIKFGGGLRVKQITMKDNWAEDVEGIYGQIYDYTTTENNQTISSGVAAYEPFIGGDENSLRYAKQYTQSIPLRADNNLYFEYPINESYYPGPQVGYRKVTVKSLASAALEGRPDVIIKNLTSPQDGKSLFPISGASYGTTGKTVHEFYTAKEFPVLTDETEKENRPFQLSVPILFIGNVTISKLTASQGYSIVTNNMHGKQRMVSNYRQAPNGQFETDPISWVRYNYASTQRYYQGKEVFELNNRMVEDTEDHTLKFPDATTIATASRFTLGQQSEFFMDMRQFQDDTWIGGARVNVDVLFFLFFTWPAFVPWPSVSNSEMQLRTAVTNKVISKSGILESIEAYDGGSLVKTSNVKWDKLTGATVLTTVNNNYDALVYSYNILAYNKYQGMGAAYQNLGFAFTVNNVQAIPNQTKYYQFALKQSVAPDALFPGDEVILYTSTDGSLTNPVAHAVYTGEENGAKRLYCEQTLAASKYTALIVRSGFRNQLSVSAGSITALEDPSMKGVIAKFSKTIQVPK